MYVVFIIDLITLWRGQEELSETFGLRKKEFDYLLCTKLVNYHDLKALFAIFDTDKNNSVDKLEIMYLFPTKLSLYLSLYNFSTQVRHLLDF
jgi:hypothetical protein